MWAGREGDAVAARAAAAEARTAADPWGMGEAPMATVAEKEAGEAPTAAAAQKEAGEAGEAMVAEKEAETASGRQTCTRHTECQNRR